MKVMTDDGINKGTCSVSDYFGFLVDTEEKPLGIVTEIMMRLNNGETINFSEEYGCAGFYSATLVSDSVAFAVDKDIQCNFDVEASKTHIADEVPVSIHIHSANLHEMKETFRLLGEMDILELCDMFGL
jgi:hypothetical protein